MSYGRFLTTVALIASLVALGLSGVGFWRIDNESRGRRDQSCRQSEAKHQADVNELKRTYRFLTNPKKRALLGPGLARLIILTLPAREREARVDPAPPFCDEPGIGLPEPDPKIPERPKGLTHERH